jgi:hypothetical protein
MPPVLDAGRRVAPKYLSVKGKFCAEKGVGNELSPKISVNVGKYAEKRLISQ